MARLLGPEQFGIYSLALVVPILLQTFTHFGTRTAVTRYVSYHTSIGETEKARRYAQAAIIFSILAGSIFTIVSYVGASWVATTLLHRPAISSYVALASLTILGQSLLLTGIAVYTGWNGMGRASATNVLQAGLKLIASPLLILLGFGISGAIVGHVASFVVAGSVSAALLYTWKIKLGIRSLSLFVADAKTMVKFGLLPFVGNAFAGLSIFFVSVLLALVANNANVGYYQAASNMVVPLTLLTAATASALYPAFTSLHGTKGDTRLAFTISVKYSGYLIAPFVFLLAATAPNLVDIFYGTSFSPAGNFLILLSLAYSPILLGQTVIPNFFNAIGRTRLTLCVTGGGALAIFAIAPLLSVELGMGVPGLIYSIFVSNSIIAVVGVLLAIKRRLGSVDFRSAAAVFASSVVGLTVCYLVPFLGSHWLSFVAELLIFATIYLTLAPLFGAVSPADVGVISASLGEMPVVGRILAVVLSFEGHLASRGLARSREKF